MSLRISQSLLFNRSLTSIQRNTRAGLLAQQQIATGKRVQNPSDDPTSFVRILPLRRDLQSILQNRDNRAIALEALGLGDSALQQATQLMSDASATAVEGANGTMSSADRATLGDKVEQILQEMLSVANSQRSNSYLFGGSRNDAAPFTRLDGPPGGTRVRYNGNDQRVEIEVGPGVDTALAVPGDVIFMRHARTATIFTGSTGAKPGSGTDNGVGFGRLDISHTGYTGLPAGITAGGTPATALGNLAFTVLVGPPATISAGGGPAVAFTAADTDLPVTTAAGTRIQLNMSAYTPAAQTGTLVSTARMTLDGGATSTVVDYSSGNQVVLDSVTGTLANVDSRGIDRTGTSELKFGGTFDVFTALVALRDALKNTNGLSDLDATRRISSLSAELNGARESVLKGLQDLGGRAERVTLMGTRLDSLELTLTAGLSDEEDVDLTEAILSFNKSDLAYRASLSVGARLVQTTLLDFLA